MNMFTKEFAELGKDDAGIAGGKGASLGEMTRAGIPVPPGFVVLAGAFERFLDESNLAQELHGILDHVNRDDMASVEHASEQIQSLILSAQMPEDIAAEIMEEFQKLGAQFVAVRSSATAEDSSSAAWAGQLDTFLNTTEDQLLKNVQRCWASLFTPRAIFYRFEKGMHGTHISVAVVVQKMVQSEVSGIAFSVHPVTEDRNQLIIEAGFGLGEAIVSGQVTPDSYVIEKMPRRIIDTAISYQSRALWRANPPAGGGGNEWRQLTEEEGSKPSLSPEQVLELAELIIHIEQHYGFPCDIEWAYEAGSFYITQSRPITTLSIAPAPEPTHFNFPFVKMGRWTMRTIDVENWHTEHTSRYFEQHFGLPKEMLAVMILDEGEPYNYMYIPKRFVDKLHEYVRMLTASDVKGLEKKLLPFYEWREEARREVPKITAADFTKLSDAELLDLYRRDRDWAHKIVVFDQFGWIVEDYWTPILAEKMKKFGLAEGTPEYHDVLFKLIKPHEISTTLEEKRAVIAMALQVMHGQMKKEAAAGELAAAYGWMPVLMYGTPWDTGWYEKELEDTTLRGEMALAKEHDELARYSEIRDADIAAIVKRFGISDEDLQPFIDFGLLIDTRNEAEYVVSICGYYLLPIYAEIARRFKMSVDDLRLLFEDDIAACLSGQGDSHALLPKRKGSGVLAWGFDAELGRRVTLSGEDAREVFAYVEAHSTVAGAREEHDGKQGVSASPGKAQGRARIIRSPQEGHRVEQGDILITFATTVDYLPAMKKAAAIVTEVGGLTCHAAVVSREFGIPCVVGLKNAMSDFKDGDIIEVDADNGIVRILGHAAESDTKQTFIKTLERDSTLLIQGLFSLVMKEDLSHAYDLGIPFSPMIVHYATADNIQIWENEAGMQWLLDRLLVENHKGTAFIESVIREHNSILPEIKTYCAGPPLDAEALRQFFPLLRKGILGVLLCYYSGLDERTPPEVQKLVVEMRKDDEVFAQGNALLKASIVRIGVPEEYAHLVLPHEVPNIPSIAELKKRAQGIILIDGAEMLLGTLTDFAKSHPDFVFTDLVTTVDEVAEVRGQIAHKGKVQGTVHIVKNARQASAVQAGDILVSPMTTPDFLPAMKIAAAFVTDEGGIACHAAVIARELKKPCIIGTKIATQVLKDGDLVEVDADNGVVRKV